MAMLFNPPARCLDSSFPRKRMQEAGYVLLTLLLFTAFLVIAAAVVAPSIAFQIKRDREQELIHRGVQYTRAIRAFTKATARYPLRMEELQSTESRRFIRKLYKDPMTGNDFRILHLSDVHPATAITNNLSPNPPASPKTANAGGDSQSPPDQSANVGSAATSGDGTAAAAARDTAPQQQSPLQNPEAQPATTANNDGFGGGGVILGVASDSKARSIREFDKKRHYNEWLFFYDPGYDRGLQINGPTSLAIPSFQPLSGATPAQAQPQTQQQPVQNQMPGQQ